MLLAMLILLLLFMLLDMLMPADTRVVMLVDTPGLRALRFCRLPAAVVAMPGCCLILMPTRYAVTLLRHDDYAITTSHYFSLPLSLPLLFFRFAGCR